MPATSALDAFSSKSLNLCQLKNRYTSDISDGYVNKASSTRLTLSQLILSVSLKPKGL